ncbi:MAG: tyrosine--tRNA ligase, partial [Burkholderiaceae bacterium]|nr:tyrosine--tRNA ligase [Burkholderiaceae bacterium]
KNNYIGITEPPFEMFSKTMSISDELMWRWYDLVSLRSNEEIKALQRQAVEGRNPRDIKVLLAREIVARFHSGQAAEIAAFEFKSRFKMGAIPNDIPDVAVKSVNGGISISALLKQAGLAPSTSEANRNIDQGGVKIDGAKVDDRALIIRPGTYVVQVGKRKWARVTVA